MKILLLLFTCNLLYSQNHLIYDELNRQAIPFAEVELINNDSSHAKFYTNKDGFIQIGNTTTLNQIRVSIPGYVSKIVKSSELKDTIFIEKKIIELKEVFIKPIKKEFDNVGFSNNKKETLYSCSQGLETVVFLENTFHENKIIKSFLCNVKKRKSYTSAIRIHMYEKGLDDLSPGKEITNDNIIHYLEGTSNEIVEIELSSYNLTFPTEGLFVGIEWLGEFKKEGGIFVDSQQFETSIELNDSIDKPISFVRNRLKNTNWSNLCANLKKYANITTANCLNASFEMKVYKE